MCLWLLIKSLYFLYLFCKDLRHPWLWFISLCIVSALLIEIQQCLAPGLSASSLPSALGQLSFSRGFFPLNRFTKK